MDSKFFAEQAGDFFDGTLFLLTVSSRKNCEFYNHKVFGFTFRGFPVSLIKLFDPLEPVPIGNSKGINQALVNTIKKSLLKFGSFPGKHVNFY